MIERTCTGCGRTFRSTDTRCTSCQRQDIPDRSAREIARSNARRARKRAAEVAGPVPAEVYAAVLVSGPCVYCGRPASQVDHVRPLARGGAEHPANLVPACARCNASKGSRVLTEWWPDRVAYGVTHHPAVAAEYARLTTGHPAGSVAM